MAYVLADKVSQSVWHLRCTGCGDQVATMTELELGGFVSWLQRQAQKTVYCFDCDPGPAEEAQQIEVTLKGRRALDLARWMDGNDGISLLV